MTSPYTPDTRLSLGLRVRTVAKAQVSKDWTATARASRRFPVEGEIVAEHDSHGPCYDVRHADDGSIGHYEPDELEPLYPPIKPTGPQWIECNLPWGFRDLGLPDELEPPPPDTSDKERAAFGKAYKDLHNEAEFAALEDLFLTKIPWDATPAVQRAEETRLAKENRKTHVLRAMRLCEKISRWREELPEYKAWEAEYDAKERDWRAEQKNKSFQGLGLNKPGVQVVVNGRRYLIGNINPLRGVCDDCAAFDDGALVTRYRVLVPQEPEEVSPPEAPSSPQCPHCEDKGGCSECNVCGLCMSCRQYHAHAENCPLGPQGPTTRGVTP